MSNRIHRWFMCGVVAACVVAGLSNSRARAEEPGKDEPKKTEVKKDDAPKVSEPAPRPVKMTPRRQVAVPIPTVKLKPGEMPAAEFETPVYDFNEARAGTEVKFDYKFKNTGTGPLEILRVKPGCGCTTAGDYTKIVQPGESGVIPIKLKPGTHAGPVHKAISVTTNIPGAGQTITLEIKGTVWAPVQVTPRSAAFGRLTPDRITPDMTRKLTLVNNLETPMKPGKIEVTNDAFQAKLNTVEEGKKYELVVSLTDKVGPGNNSTRINVETGLDDPKSVDVQAYVFMSPPVDVTPNKLVIPKPRPTELVRTFYIRSNTANLLEISDLKCTSDKLKLHIEDIRGDKRTYRLTVTIPPNYEPPAQGDEITFKTDEPSLPIGHIPVTGSFDKDAAQPAK